MTRLALCRLIDLPRITDPRGDLTFIEESRHIPFDMQRVYYVYDVPAGASRGGHAHKELEQFVIAAAGSFDVVLHDGQEGKSITLDHPGKGLYLPRMIWRELIEFTEGAVCLVVASAPYDESDYYRDFDEFRAAASEDG